MHTVGFALQNKRLLCCCTNHITSHRLHNDLLLGAGGLCAGPLRESCRATVGWSEHDSDETTKFETNINSVASDDGREVDVVVGSWHALSLESDENAEALTLIMR